VIWALILFKPFLGLVGRIIEMFGLPNPAAEGFAVASPDSPTSTAALYGLSMLHTLFNTINTLVLIWFTKLIEKAVIWIIKAPKNQEKEVFRLKYISAGPLATPELAAEQAFDEIIHFAQISRNGLGYAREAIVESDQAKFDELRDKLIKYEEISDRIEFEIAAFLNAVSEGDISEETSRKIKAMYKIIGEMESLGDSGETISRILSRRNVHKKEFDKDTLKNLADMAAAVDNAYEAMIVNLTAAHKGELEEILNAYNAETRINNLRNFLRDAEIEGLESNRKSYQASVYYMDIVNELEKMGDFIINISQTLEKAFVK
jgi:phosphate:Na+ symporter